MEKTVGDDHDDNVISEVRKDDASCIDFVFNFTK